MAAEANLRLLRQHAAVILARQQAMREVKRRRQKQGIKGPLPFSTLSRLANGWLDAHPELIAQAAADPIVLQISQVSIKKRRPAAQALLVCKSHERNGARK
jgi:hypothetical protein